MRSDMGMRDVVLRLCCYLGFSCLIFNPAIAEEEGIVTWTQSAYTILVDDPESVSNRIVQRAENSGGYFLFRNNTAIRLNIPAKVTEEFAKFIEQQGEVVSSSYDANDIRSKLEAERTILKARKSVLEQYISVLNEADADNLVYVESELSNLVQEIELAKGRVRFLEHKARFARVEISFRFRDRTAPIRKKESSFEWLNQVGLPELLQEFNNVSS